MNQDVQASSHVLAQLLDFTLEGLAYFSPLYDGARITDFLLETANRTGHTWLSVASPATTHPTEVGVGSTIRSLYPWSVETGLFDELVRVYQTQQPTVREQHYPSLDQWATLRTSATTEGLLIAFTDITAQRQAELRAKEANRLLKNVLQASPNGVAAQEVIKRQATTFDAVLRATMDGILILEAIRDESGQLIDLRYEYVSDQNLRDTGYSREQLIGSTICTFFPGVRQSRIWTAYENVLATGQAERFEEHYQADGFDNVLVCQVFRIDENRLVSNYQLINDLWEAQRQAEYQTELLRSVLDGSQNAIIAFDAVRDPTTGQITDFRYVLQNEANRHRVKRTDEEVIGHTMLEFFPNVRDNGLFAEYAKVVETGVAFRQEVAYDYGGGAGWYDLSVVKRAEGIVLTVQDKTEQKQAELAVQQQADTLEKILDSLPVSVYVAEGMTDPLTGNVVDFWIREANTLARQAFTAGMSRADLIGKLASDIFPQNREDGIFEAYASVANTGQPIQFERPYDLGDKTVWVDVRMAPFGQKGVISSVLDITNLKQLQLQLEQQNLDLLRSNDNLQQFAYVASHDLQEPLRKIQSFGDMLLDTYRTVLDADGQDLLRRMQSASNRMSLLITDLLNYSRLSTKREPFGSVPLADLLTEVLDDLQVAVQNTNAQVELIDLPAVQGDKAQLRQLFQNLLSNALKFQQAGSSPHIQVTCQLVTKLPDSAAEAPTIGADTRPGKRKLYYEINVIDNGIGFEEKYLDRIFGVFQRLHGKNQYPGSGIGLAICRKVVENHQGVLTASSQPNQGATFRVYLPK